LRWIVDKDLSVGRDFGNQPTLRAGQSDFSSSVEKLDSEAHVFVTHSSCPEIPADGVL
jgi:hypothetical protein